MARTHQGSFSRRDMLKVGGGFAAGFATIGWLDRAIAQSAASTPAGKTALTPDQALNQLMAGNDRFVHRKRTNPHQDFARITEVAKGQKPFASILGCADSRVPAEIVFDQGFGDLFVCRVAGNLAIPEQIGSLEFGALVLGTKVIMVLGHERCGAVSAAVKAEKVPGQISTLVTAIKPALEKVQLKSKDALEMAVKANVMYQMEKLKTSPVLTELINKGELKIVGGYYDLDTGKVVQIA